MNILFSGAEGHWLKRKEALRAKRNLGYGLHKIRRRQIGKN